MSLHRHVINQVQKESGKLPSGGGPGTLTGLSKPLVNNYDHAFRILTVNLAAFNRDTYLVENEGFRCSAGFFYA